MTDSTTLDQWGATDTGDAEEISDADDETESGTRTVDEHGESDEWGRGGVYDAAGEFDLEATEELLVERFAHVDNELPDRVGPFERVDARDPRYADGTLSARYETCEEYPVVVRIFSAGPHLNEWTVEITEYGPPVQDDPPADTGYDSSGSYWLDSASQLEDPADAADAAVDWMGEFSPDVRKVGPGDTVDDEGR
ncbi:hypothetical protein [Halosimplex pelagicum]|uniref:Uncharacterized protein n=1 Tax=Halosimplex pelagicum TaxID=869886 RepID=A0A7D5TCT0_9EURY|nr:hypothetical protein [Halosimplex pelagicum]QLH83209.1 hypothetical protein HZS54_16930 [Halosimplex pelagicum]